MERWTNNTLSPMSSFHNVKNEINNIIENRGESLNQKQIKQ